MIKTSFVQIRWFLKALISLVLGTFLLSCGTVKVVSTPPEADVFAVIPGVSEPKLLGKTPYEESVGNLGDQVNTGTIVIMVKKEGFFPENFIVPNLSGGDLEIETSLKPNLYADYQKINGMVGRLFEAERLIKQQRFDDVLKIVENLKKTNENVAATYHISGTVYFLKKDFKRSAYEWQRAIELEPENNEARRMLSIILKKIGGKMPSKPEAAPSKEAK